MPFTPICPHLRNLISVFCEQTRLSGSRTPSHTFAQGRVEATGVKVKKPISCRQRGREIATVIDLRIVTYICMFKSMLVTLANPLRSYFKRQILCLPPQPPSPMWTEFEVICH